MISLRKIGFFSIFSNFATKFWWTKCLQRRISEKIEKKIPKIELLGPVECWKEQSHEKWTHLSHSPRSDGRSSAWGGSSSPPPCRIGLKNTTDEYPNAFISRKMPSKLCFLCYFLYKQEVMGNLSFWAFSAWKTMTTVLLTTFISLKKPWE